MAQIATGNTEDALDIVQDAMFKLVDNYASKSEEDWVPLFHRILQSRIKDWYRKNSVRNRFRGWLSSTDHEEQGDPINEAEDLQGRNPEQLVHADRRIDQLEKVVNRLPLRQQQAFLLRTWEGLDTRETAKVMACSEGSVKTHYSRAIHALREQLGEYWS